MRRFFERFAGTMEEEVEGLGLAVAVVEGEGGEKETVEVDWGTRWEMVCSPMGRRRWN